MDQPHTAAAGTAVLRSLQGTIQRVNYLRKEMTIVAQGQVWRFTLAADCQLRFNDAPAILRCFHALDQVTVVFDDQNEIRALSAWERASLQAA
jgi:hypothetical protein